MEINRIIYDKFPIEYQMTPQSCGPVSLMMVAKYFGYNYSLEQLSHLCGLTHEGVSLANLAAGAESIGLHTLSVRCSINDVATIIQLPAIVLWHGNHFIVVYDVDKDYFYVSDPAKGLICYSYEEFSKGWYLEGEKTGILMAIEPTIDNKVLNEE